MHRIKIRCVIWILKSLRLIMMERNIIDKSSSIECNELIIALTKELNLG